MSFLRLVIQSLIYQRRINATVALSVAAATAVLVGALLVGDSVRGSLRSLTLDSLGRIDELLLADRFFSTRLLTDLKATDAFQQHYDQAVGTMMFPQGTVERQTDQTDQTVHRAANVLIIGCQEMTTNGSDSFWQMEEPAARPARVPVAGEIVLNEPLAQELDAAVGDSVTLRLPMPEGIPADSPLGEKEDRIRSLPRLEVIEIISAKGLGGFRLTPRQTVSRNAFVSLEQLQDAIDQPDHINAILVAGGDRQHPPDPAASADLTAALRPSLDDYGLTIDHPQLVFEGPPTDDSEPESNSETTAAEDHAGPATTASSQPQVIYDYYRLFSDRMILEPEIESAAQAALAEDHGQPLFTYLANRIQRLDTEGQPTGPGIPYSMVTAINLSPHFALKSSHGQPIQQLLNDQIVLTSWAAEDLGVQPGDRVAMTFFEPETTHQESAERTVTLQVQAITPLVEPAEPYMPDRELVFDQQPTLANDPFMTPEVQGLTDQRSINNWDVPFSIDFDRIRSQDDVYWEEYGTTPKAYIALATGQRLWGSRFGQATSFRIPNRTGLDQATISDRLRKQLQVGKTTLGFQFRRIKQQQLAASTGNTPFDVLFLLLSFFIIAAALMLVAILFRLGFQQRASQAGLLLAVGWSERRVRRLFVLEGTCVAATGGLLGLGIGIGYAHLILTALSSKSWWLGAVTTPFLTFHFTWHSLLIGYVSGVLICLATIAWSVYRTRGIPARSLLAGQTETSFGSTGQPSRIGRILPAVMLIGSIGLAFVATSLGGQSQAGAFVGAGATLLTALLWGIWNTLRRSGRGQATITGHLPLVRLAARSAARNPSRSSLTIGLIAAASFLIVAMSAFQLKPSQTGTGGFDLVAESSQPVLLNLDNQQAREELWGDQAADFEQSLIYSFRLRPGDDAGCGNLYQARQPRVLGVPQAFIQHFDDPQISGFSWAASAADQPAERNNPWRLLNGTDTSSAHQPTNDRSASETTATASKDSSLSAADDPATAAPEAPIPVVIDKDTAMYSLHLYQGVGEEFSFTYDGRPIRFRVAGLLSISVLHGNLLIGEDDFRRLFPNLSGYRYFLIDAADSNQANELSNLLESSLGDQGFDATECQQVLVGLLAIQNTYLRTFQSLGALGLLLGTFGLGAVQLRSVLERRREMALLRAIGYRSVRLIRMVVIESLFLLLAGLGTGVIAATFAVLPHAIQGDTSIPVAELSTMLLVIFLVGITTGTLAAKAVSRTPVLDALREER